MGPKSWPGLQYLQAIPLRLTITADVCHRIHNDWNIVGMTGLHTHKLEWKCVLSLRQGPYKQGAHHSLLKEVARELSRRKWSNNDITFNFLYDGICAECSLGSSMEVGSAEHMEQVFTDMCMRLDAAPRHDMKLSRWFSWEARARSLLEGVGLHSLCYLLTQTGIRKGWWKSYYGSPLCGRRPDAVHPDNLDLGDAGPDHSVSAAAADDADGDQDQEEADQGIEACPPAGQSSTAKVKREGNMHLASRVIATSLSRR
eukprot:536389-Amphidinium_carterae.1